MIERIVQTTLMAGLPFGLIAGLLGLAAGPVAALLVGVLSGASFGLAMAIFAEVQRRRMQSVDSLFEGEPVLFEGPANHVRTAESVGGWLTLTPTRLAFRSHGVNVQNRPFDVSLGEIDGVRATRTALVFPNGLRVAVRDGRTESFVVYQRGRWVKEIALRLAKQDRPA